MENHSPAALKSARRLRGEMSLPEVLLWQIFRKRPVGVKFRRQHPIGEMVVDFYCAERKLAVEIDGVSHNMGDQPARDTRRDAYLASIGIQVIRVPAAEVLKNSVDIADSIIRLCNAVPPPSALRAATSPKGGGFLGIS